ncbi:TPA_asm: coat protein [ssRNA phage Esthiorhiza.4_6]|uniref:Coat protein n=2 Tax=Leviviricetes TaxID=2842243 RepID=A0A8S5L3F6_9VIRU|nr:coat protein [ssRNA phage Esthiorhiza.4_6]QDH87679.1 MAG: hypothetical protein H4RhizoLitter20309_000002 [Leviviridae sp.]DAD51911.1 TPA_asm: coat protein [ssRNA phage Esthiorhiza.4_6]
MFDNIVKLVSIVDSDHKIVTSTAIGDGPAGRKTSRPSADGKTVLTIAHQDSNENPGFSTQRSTVRIARSFTSSDSDAVVTPYVQFTMSVPKDEVSVAQIEAMVNQLVTFLKSAENSAEASVHYDGDYSSIPRLWAGEP